MGRVPNVRLDLGSSVQLLVSEPLARSLADQLQAALGPTPRATRMAERLGTFLPDDDPHWLSHSGLEGHRDFPEWTNDDVKLARAYYDSLSGKARVFFDVLIDHPGQRVSADQFVAFAPETFATRRSVASALTGLHGLTRKFNHRFPFEWWRGNPTDYAMKSLVAELFRRARSLR
jgi:hypothetical protein